MPSILTLKDTYSSSEHSSSQDSTSNPISTLTSSLDVEHEPEMKVPTRTPVNLLVRRDPSARRTAAGVVVDEDLEVTEEEIIKLSSQIRHLNFMFTPATSSKQGGWNYEVVPVILEGDSLIFDPAGGDYTMDQSVVTFNCVPFEQPYFTQDSHDWIQRKMMIDTKHYDLPHIMIAKQHKAWANRPNLARSQALERVKSNLYAARMLKLFKEGLENSMTSRSRAIRTAASEMHQLSLGLKIPPNSLVKTFGKHESDYCEWLLCDAPHHRVNQRYVHPYKFESDQKDKWSDFVHAFVHYSYHRTGAHSLVAQVDCDQLGSLSNLVCFTRGYQHVGIPGMDIDETVKMAFVHFKASHQCNDICNILGLKNVKTGYPINHTD
ncbi:hypothetical protein DFH28DRAFT_909110 [Melampsora americana]|nr:hypothetical protein DFH28DRAFT_909110 [Melampsora americana]